MKPVVSSCGETRGNATSLTAIRLFISRSPEFHIQGLLFTRAEAGVCQGCSPWGLNSLQAGGS